MHTEPFFMPYLFGLCGFVGLRYHVLRLILQRGQKLCFRDPLTVVSHGKRAQILIEIGFRHTL